MKKNHALAVGLFLLLVASVILFLASDLSAAVTGQEILADRGWAHS